jgi:capsular exopolysaccharide synthesis family protein
MNGHNEYGSNASIIKDFISKAFSIKYYYLACLFLCLVIAFAVNKFTPTVYRVNTIIGPMENERSVLLASNDLFRGLSALEQAKNLENDINNIKSFTLVASTLNKMNLEVGYFNGKNNFFGQTVQMYPGPPFIVNLDKSHIQPLNAKFRISILDRNTFKLTCDEEAISLYNYVDNDIVRRNNVLKIDTLCHFNETISNRNFKFSVSLSSDYKLSDTEYKNQYYFEFYHLDNLARSYLANIVVKPVSIRSSLLEVSFTGKNLDLTIDFLNNFTKNFLNDNLAKKNKKSADQIRFIDDQITDISDSLTKSESDLRNFRSANQVMDLSYQGRMAYEQMNEVENQRTSLATQERYYNYILDYLDKNKDGSGLVPPSGFNVVDPVLNTLILDLAQLYSERSRIPAGSGAKNIFLGQIDSRINSQLQAIRENVKNNLATLTQTKSELSYRAERISREISRLPRTELNMVSMQRKFNLSDQIYTFLLQKRSEAQITMYSNYPDYEILEPARDITRTIISPKKVTNLMFAFLMGLLLPTAYLVLKNFFNEKITSVHETENILKRPVLSTIFTNTRKGTAIVTENPGSAVAESFRNLRGSLFLRFKNEPIKVIMVTSSQPEEGKSFVSSNLAASIATVGHKTVILDCDLRRPRLHEAFKIENTKGITNYLADNATKETIIHKTDTENLYFIPAGPALANSTEMIEAGMLDELITYLRSHFQYVILDTSPAGMVADAMLMMRYSSMVLLVCRKDVTRKDVFHDVLNMFHANKIRNYDVVFNDLDIKTSKYGHYGRYYNKH